MRALVIPVLILLSLSAAAQDLPCNGRKAQTMVLNAFFEGYLNKADATGRMYDMSASYFHGADIRLSLSDTTYQVYSYTFSFDTPGGRVTEIPVSGPVLRATKSMDSITRNSLVTVDNIMVRKNGECFKVAAFICRIIE